MKVQKKFLGWKDVEEITGLSESTLRRLEAKGVFPKRIILSSGRVAFDVDALQDWIVEKTEQASASGK